MGTATRWLGAVGVLSLVTCTALAQPPEGGAGRGGRGAGRGGMMGGGMGSPAMLVGNKDVQKELSLTDDQVKKAEEAAQKVREKHQ